LLKRSVKVPNSIAELVVLEFEPAGADAENGAALADDVRAW
jgi:hypothetical protein